MVELPQRRPYGERPRAAARPYLGVAGRGAVGDGVRGCRGRAQLGQAIGPRPADRDVRAVSPDAATSVARAVDELRRGQVVRITSPAGDLDVLATELADDLVLTRLETDARAGLIVTARRAAVLHIVNQPAAAGQDVVWIDRPAWLDLAATVAIADPGDDLRLPFKGPFRTCVPTATAAAQAAVRLAKLGGILPAVFAVPAGGGTPLTAAAADILSYARADRLRIVTRARLPLDGAPDTEVVAFRPAEGGPEHLALVIGPRGTTPPVLTRLHSACLTGDVLGSLKCDCGPQLRAALAAITAAGGGVLLYLQQEGRGIGLINKLRAYALQDQGFDTVDANLRLGFEPDERDFAVAATMLRLLGVGQVRLLTNNPDKVASLSAHGIDVVERIAHSMPPNPHNADYLATKRDRSGHYL
ncbi:GTP cyclohydrolase II [Polymorphobacter megasporae]|nr:GTP cyclohydrolase II [Polymorphobacter megasporae]